MKNCIESYLQLASLMGCLVVLGPSSPSCRQNSREAGVFSFVCFGWLTRISSLIENLFLSPTCPEIQENDGALVPENSRVDLTRLAVDSVLSLQRCWFTLWWDRTRLVFCDSFKNEKFTRFPSYFNELVATEITLICVLFALPRANFANQFACWRAQVF